MIKYCIVIFLLIIFPGCTSTYQSSYFSSKDKFYEDFNNSSANENIKITLSNDSLIFAGKGTKIANDTLLIILPAYVNSKFDANGNRQIEHIQVKKIKEISYRKHWTGVSLGFLGGAAVGLGIGGLFAHYDAEHMGPDDVKDMAYLKPLLYGAVIGPIAGSVLGWLIGREYIYEFNP